MGAAARPLGDGSCPWITGHNGTKTGHGRNLALNSSFGQDAPRQSFFQRIAATHRATKKPAAVSRTGIMRSFGYWSFLEDSRYASQIIF
jgi:hypothetical protein